MGLSWSVGNIKDYKNLCYERMTDEQAEAQGTTLDELLGQTSFTGPHWYRLSESDIEKLAAGQDCIERLNPLTHVLIWATMSVDMGKITEDNWQEFWLRLHLAEKTAGPFVQDRGSDGKWHPRAIKPEEVKAHIGLSCNVCTEPWVVWMKKHMDRWRSQVMKAHGVEDTRAADALRTPLSQVGGDALDAWEEWKAALERHDLDDNNDEENRQHSRDYRLAQRVSRDLAESVDYWESREIEIAFEEEEGEEE